MSFLTQMLATANPNDDRLYTSWSGGVATPAGVAVDPETALKLSAFWACDRLLCETVASLPALVFERLGAGRRRAVNHPLYDVLHRQPNEYQTPIEFFDFLTHSAAMRGNGFARIVAGPRGFADQLVPLHPDHVRMEKLANNKLRYRINEPGKAPEILSDAEVLHVKGMSADGVTGTSVITYARDSLGLGLAAERYGSRFFRNNAEPRGVLKSLKSLSPEAGKRLIESWEAAHSGENQNRLALLEEGLEYQAISLNNKDSQFLESREFQAEDVCRWWRTPPHMVGLTSKATSWGSGIEQMGQGFITYTLMPWLVRWQQAISRDLILAPDKYFVEFVVDALLRGDTKGRYDAYAVGRQWGWLSPNDIRERENMNPVDGGDRYDTPMNMNDLSAAPARPTQPAGSGQAHYQQLVKAAAGRVVRKEVAALTKAARRAEGWVQAVGEFYGDHAEFVAQTMSISLGAAQGYCDYARRAAEEHESALPADWENSMTAMLITMAREAA